MVGKGQTRNGEKGQTPHRWGQTFSVGDRLAWLGTDPLLGWGQTRSQPMGTDPPGWGQTPGGGGFPGCFRLMGIYSNIERYGKEEGA